MTISVVIPTYNRGALIEKTLLSALSQDITPEEFEVLVIDDGSTDDTFAFLEQNYGANPRVRLFSIPNGGVARARNFGLEQARGEFIAYLDHDDIWLPQKLRLQKQVLMQNPQAGVVYCKWLGVDEWNRPVADNKQFCQQSWWQPAQGQVYPWIYCPGGDIPVWNPIISMSVPMMKTELLRKIGGFDPDTVPCDDWDLWIRLSKIAPFVYVDETLVWYVFHAGQQHINIIKGLSATIDVINKHSVSKSENFSLWEKQDSALKFLHGEINYHLCKAAIFSRHHFLLFQLLVRQLLSAPRSLLSKKYLYLVFRVLTFNSKHY